MNSGISFLKQLREIEAGHIPSSSTLPFPEDVTSYARDLARARRLDAANGTTTHQPGGNSISKKQRSASSKVHPDRPSLSLSSSLLLPSLSASTAKQ